MPSILAAMMVASDYSSGLIVRIRSSSFSILTGKVEAICYRSWKCWWLLSERDLLGVAITIEMEC